MNELDLFAAAIGLLDPTERAEFLDRECEGSSLLRQRLEKLLDAHFRSNELLDASPGPQDATAMHYTAALDEGAIIAGRYKLLEPIGEGGMGTVWVAEQTEPVRRKVALKLIKAGMDSKSVLARFEAERQALAVMDHPNIAKVLDGGMTETGRPFFVMEYVKGVPITEYCDAKRLSVPERLTLFAQVCQAVQHAHQKGIIHRDLKPSNILVAPYDDKPVPKVIDFGLAKAMNQALTERTLHTAHETVLGTPLYMSPEQAQLNNLDVDTRSDVYSLGVLLYELLTGTTPLEKQRFKQAAWDEIKRIIREEEPPRPSTRLSSSQALASLAAGRQSEPSRLTNLLRGDLDWIVMKAIEKDRSRRYETANGFAADVLRYLSGEAVLAHPPTWWYRYQKFTKRHRGAILATYLLFVGVVIFTGSLYSQVERAKAAEKLAVKAKQAETERAEGERQAKLEAQANEKLAGERLIQVEAERKKADAARVEAQAKEAEANAVVSFIEDHVFAAARPKGVEGGLGHDVSLRSAIEASLPELEKNIGNQPRIEATLRNALGRTYVYSGEAAKTLEQYTRARELYAQLLGPEHPRTLECMYGQATGFHAQGRFAESLKLRVETMEIRKRVLPKDHPDTLQSMKSVASSLFSLGRHAEALKLGVETLEIQRRVLPKDHRDTLMSMSQLAVIYSALSRHDEAVKLLEETLEIQRRVLPKDHSDTLASMYHLASGYFALGRNAEALKLYEETLAARRRALGPDHRDTIRTLRLLARSYADLNRYAEALPLFEDLWKILKEKLPEGNRYRIDAQNYLGLTLLLAGRLAEAEPHLLDSYRDGASAKDFPKDWKLTYTVRLTSLYAEWEKPAERDRWRAEMNKAGGPLDSYLVGTGSQMLQASRFQAAETLLRDCLAVREKTQPDHWTTSTVRSKLGGALLGQKKYAEAEPLLRAGYEGMKQREQMITEVDRRRLPEALDRMIDFYTATNKPDEVKKWKAERAKYDGQPTSPASK